MSECHFFDVEVANDVGVNCAIIFQNFCFWIKKNASERQNFKDGEYWSFSSIKGMKEFFPYLSEKQIRTALDTLIEKKYLKKAQLCDNKVNRTNWYTLDEKGKCIRPTGQMESPSRANGNAPQGKCNIEDIKKKIDKEDIASSLRSEDKAQEKFDPRKELFYLGCEGQVISDFLSHRKEKKAKFTKTALDGFIRESRKAGIHINEALKICCLRGWAGFKADWYEKDKPKTEDFLDYLRNDSFSNLNTIDITENTKCLTL